MNRRAWLFAVAALLFCGTLSAGKAFLIVSSGKKGERPAVRVDDRGMARSKEYEEKTHDLLLGLPAREKEQETEIVLKGMQPGEVSFAVRGRCDVGSTPSHRKYLDWVIFKRIEINGNIVVGPGGKDAKKIPEKLMVARTTKLKYKQKFNRGDKIRIRLVFCEPPRKKCRELTRAERLKDREARRKK